MANNGHDARAGTAGDVLVAFLRLGVTAFGGPVAHLGYFRDELITRRRWVDDRSYGELVALAQFLPGPASSQVGFGLGLARAGWWGALAAFVAFTLPSAVLMTAFASGVGVLRGPIAEGAIEGLKIVAVAIVAQAVWGMARTLAPDRTRASLAVGAAVIALTAGVLGQVAAIVAAAIVGIALCRGEPERPAALRIPLRRRTGVGALALLAGLLVVLPVAAAATGDGALRLADVFFRSGAFVFGGGHVVLPLLESQVVAPGWVSASDFLAGYGAAQAMPGPLFTFAAYLGALSTVGPGGIAGAAIALVAVFLPGFLLLIGVLPFWNALRGNSNAQAVVRGANAAVVGILAAALYDPVWVQAITGPAAFGLALVAFVLLTVWRTPPWAVVLLAAGAGAISGAL